MQIVSLILIAPLTLRSQREEWIRVVTSLATIFLEDADPAVRQSTLRTLARAYLVLFNGRHVGLSRFLDHIPYVQGKRTVSIDPFHHTALDSANFFRRLLGTNILFADKEYNVVYKPKRMSEH